MLDDRADHAALRLQIGLVLIGRKTRADEIPNLSKMATAWNNAQGDTKAFVFVPLAGFLQVAEALPTGLHTHANATYFDMLVEYKRGKPDLTGLIGLTADELRDGRFNAHDARRSVGVVTIKDMNEVRLRGMDAAKYIGYLVLCEAFCVAGQLDFEADDHLGCLFDRCDDKDTLRDCLAKPIINDRNAQRLLKVGFQQGHLDASRHLLEQYVAKLRWVPPFPKEVVVWALGFVTGVSAEFTFFLIQAPTGALWEWRTGGVLGFILVGLAILLTRYPGGGH